MKDIYSKYNSQYSWHIKEEGWVKGLQQIRESQLALGNGFLGTRAVLEEIPYDSKPGTYISGLYDTIGSQVAELVNLPNPFNFNIVIEGERLGVGTMDVVEHKRILDMKYGLLSRHTVLRDSKKRCYDYQSLRFLSMYNKNIGVMQVTLTPLDSAVDLSIETGIDTSVHNIGTVTEGRKRHFRVDELGKIKDEGYLVIETFDKRHLVIFRSGFYYETKGKKIFAKDNIFELRLHKNQTVTFTKIFYIGQISYRDSLVTLKNSSEKNFRKAFRSSFSTLIKKQKSCWEDMWKTTGITIWGQPDVEKNLRFNIYHMMICAPNDEGFSSIGARSLTGEGYHGHIFWDTEIFLMPFYIYNMPHIARNMLLYRYKHLCQAKENAKKLGFKGAMYPWECAGIGKDETPEWAKDLDGKIIKIYTGKLEHHITAVVAYGVYHYFKVTDDKEFLRDYGYEILFETARFWASRVKYNKRKSLYEIKEVIGPDEFHENVNNNAFTNMMAKWNLLTAYRLVCGLRRSDKELHKKLVSKCDLSVREIAKWKVIATHINLKINTKKVIEQFDGYFKKRQVKITSIDADFIPNISEKISPREYDKTQLVKQADVLMLLYLFSDVFSLKTKAANYKYYIERTLHRSSLSFPIHSIMAAEAQDKSRAYSYFLSALRTDVANLHGNTFEGIHAACVGGTWQAVINGFAGLRIVKDALNLNPRLPDDWRSINFSIFYKGSFLKLEVGHKKVKINVVYFEKHKPSIRLKVFGVSHELKGKREFVFNKKDGIKKQAEYY
ncbi:MAG: glycosyl hydrolase family 65 protein [Candidatus Omnitrophota bacterium]